MLNIFLEKVLINIMKNYTDILLYSILHDIRKNEKKYDEIYEMHNLKNTKKKIFNQKTSKIIIKCQKSNN